MTDAQQSKLEKLNACMNHDCKKCELYKSSKHVCIQGRGNLDAPIFLVGEAPGNAESETGKPFMGRAGKLLDHLLEELGLSDKVFISNVCHCYPPDNRKPTDREIKICREYLIYELQIIQPKVIVLLGKTAMKFVESVIHRDHYLHAGCLPIAFKKFCSVPDVLVISTFHPAYCLRRGDGAIHDLRRALLWAQKQASK